VEDGEEEEEEGAVLPAMQVLPYLYRNGARIEPIMANRIPVSTRRNQPMADDCTAPAHKNSGYTEHTSSRSE
jgi:hypothetical protein